MVGLADLATGAPPIAVKSLENMSMKVFGCISLMSAPAANAFSPPASRMQPIPSSDSRSSTAAAISRNTPNDSALSILGRLSVMMPTAPLLSTMMCSNVLMIHPVPDFAGNVPADGMGFKWARSAHRVPDAVHRFSLLRRAGTDISTAFKRGPRLGSAPLERWPPRPGQEPSRHEHPCRRGQRQESAEGDENFSDQGGLVPG